MHVHRSRFGMVRRAAKVRLNLAKARWMRQNTPMKRITLAALLVVMTATTVSRAEDRTITREELRDKIAGYWIGQLVGNYLGFPFENVFQDEPCPVFVDRYYDVRDAEKVKLNDQDLRGFTLAR